MNTVTLPARAVLAALDLEQDSGQEAVGRVGQGAGARVIGEERFEVELRDGLIDEACQVVVGQFGLKGKPLGVQGVPGHWGKTALAFVAQAWGWYHSHGGNSCG